MDFRFTNEYQNTDELVSFMLGPRLWIPRGNYPDFLDWANKAYVELRKEVKRAIVCCAGTQMVGSLVYQRHKQDPELLELKNLTVEPTVRGRYVASFLLRNAEIEGMREFKSRAIVCDAKKDNVPIRMLLYRNRYRTIGYRDLYDLKSGMDAIYFKELPLQRNAFQL